MKMTASLTWVGLGMTFLHATNAVGATTHTWTGAGSNGYWSRPENWLNNTPPPANGTVNLIFPTGKPRKVSTNDIAGLIVTSLQASDYGMSFHGTGNGTPLRLNGLVDINSGSIQFTGSLTLRLNGSTTVSLGTAVVGLNTYSTSTVEFGGKITGPGGLTISGSSGYGVGNGGLARFTAHGANDYTGSTVFEDDAQMELGNYSYAPVPDSFYLVIVGTTSVPTALTIRYGADVELKRNNQIGNAASVTVLQNSRLDLSRFADTIGSFTCKGNLETEIYSASSYGRLTINGTIAITSHSEPDWSQFSDDQLRVSRNPNYTPSANTTFTLLSNDSTDAISGEFYGWPENEAANLGGVIFRLRYSGGTGNDLTLKNP